MKLVLQGVGIFILTSLSMLFIFTPLIGFVMKFAIRWYRFLGVVP
jgi:hypothetical protein